MFETAFGPVEPFKFCDRNCACQVLGTFSRGHLPKRAPLMCLTTNILPLWNDEVPPLERRKHPERQEMDGTKRSRPLASAAMAMDAKDFDPCVIGVQLVISPQ